MLAAQRLFENLHEDLEHDGRALQTQLGRIIEIETERLATSRRLVGLFDPKAALKRGYALVRRNGQLIKSVAQVSSGDKLSIELSDGKISAEST
jgi:exodeoxyribonuclease VII large subunit